MEQNSEHVQSQEEVIERIVEQVRAKLKSRLVIGPQTLDSIERQAQEIGREVTRIVENESIHECGDGYFGTRARCLCGQPARYVGSRPRRVISLGGAHSLVRPYYHCQRCGHGFSPLDRILGVERGECSHSIQALIARFSCYLPFSKVVNEMEAICGIRLSASTVQLYAKKVGQNIATDWNRRENRVWGSKQAQSSERVPQLHVSMDGVMIFVDGEWREAKLACAYQTAPGGGVAKADYYATLNNSHAFGRKVRTLAVGSGADRTNRVCVVADGAKWIWQETWKYFPTSTQILDFFHATEHLWELANSHFGPQTKEAAEWMELQKDRLLSNKVAAVIEDVSTIAPRRMDARAIKRKLVDYLTTHKHRMLYQTYRDLGLHIGSGVIEAGCKTVVQSRMKGAGMRWSSRGAESMLHLCAHWHSSEPTEFARYAN